MTDRKPKAHPALLGREEGIKNALELIDVDASAAIENRNTNRVLVVGESDHHLDTTIARRVAAHRFAGVEKQVQQHLLQFDAVALHLGKVLIDAGVDLNVALLELAPCQRQDVA